jgi:quercetin dioxygenase-like cupin family protein
MDLATLRRQFSPPGKYRVSQYTYPVGSEAHGATSRGAIHVFSGACRFSIGSEEVLLSEGDAIEHGNGRYNIKVVEDESCLITWPD